MSSVETSLQPIPDIPTYLDTRRPCPHYTAELPLFITLPAPVRADLRQLLGTRPGGGAFGHISHLVKSGLSVQKACLQTRQCFQLQRSLKRLRSLFDAWSKASDWLTLVNRSKAGAQWQARNDGLPDAFLNCCAQKFAAYKRSDAKRQAYLDLKRQYQTGRNSRGEPEPLPDFAPSRLGVTQRPFPHYSTILRALKQRQLFTPAVRALAHEGTAAARQFLPSVLGTRAGLRFMERIQFDDVKTDWRIFDPQTGTVCDLWLLIARDLATNILLGFGMRPARAREDGSQEHLKQRDVKQLLGWLLERFGLPPYLMHWVFERGTATVAEAVAAALYELLGDERVLCHWTGMEGANSATGYAERRIGNSRGKASLESCNRLMHTIGASLPGQTGNIYTRRPQDLLSREKEAVTIWQLAQQLPEHIRDQVRYPFAHLQQARAELVKIFGIQNSRTEHEMEGFEWLVDTAPDGRITRRRESPIERAAKLCRGLTFTPVSPEVIAAFYEHTQRLVTVKPTGEIEFSIDSNKVTFSPGPLPPLPPLPPVQIPGSKLLAYYHPEDPRFLHLTDGQGKFIGTWLRRDRVSAADHDALADALRYTTNALTAARDQAARLATPVRQDLEDMRAHNAQLLAAHTFVEVAQVGPRSAAQISTPVAAALASNTGTRAELQRKTKATAALAAKAEAALREAANSF